MKPLFIVVTVLASFFTTSSFAAKQDVAPVVLKAFQNSFSTAKEVNWTATANYYKAQFQWNGQYVYAFYSATGDLVALTRNISSFQLPISLQTRLKKDYSQYWITDLFEVTNDAGTSYYVTIENADAKVILKSASATAWNVYQKSQKL